MTHSHELRQLIEKDPDKAFFNSLQVQSKKLREIAKDMGTYLGSLKKKSIELAPLKSAFQKISTIEIEKIDIAIQTLQSTLQSLNLASEKNAVFWKSFTEQEFATFWTKMNAFNEEANTLVINAIKYSEIH